MSIFDSVREAVTGKARKLPVRELINKESEAATRKIFGPIPAGHRREFFCLDQNTWVWYEEWIDPDTNKPKSLTTRYEITPRGLLKAQDGKPYAFVQMDELRNFQRAVNEYHKIVKDEIYSKTYV